MSEHYLNMATAGLSEEDFRTSFRNSGRGVLGFEAKNRTESVSP